MKKMVAVCVFIFISSFCIGQSDAFKIQTKAINKFGRKKQLGVVIGVGTSTFKTSYSNWQQGNINYNDSLKRIAANGVLKLECGFVYQVYISKLISIRPTYHTVFEGGKLTYERHSAKENINLSTYSHTLSLPLVFNLNMENLQPYLIIGPALLYTMAQEDVSGRLPLESFDLLGELGVGIDFYSERLKAIISPGLKYSLGFLNAKQNNNNIYSNTLDELKRQSIAFTINFRKP